MPKLTILLKDGGVEEFETTPIQDNNNTSPTQPKQSSSKQLIQTAALLTVGRQAVNESINLVGVSTGDYILERQLKAGITVVGLGVAFAKAPVITTLGVGISQAAEARKRAIQRTRKQFQAQQNAVAIGAITTKNGLYGGAK
jgi:hypothetical protein